jgi:hypothetical protein
MSVVVLGRRSIHSDEAFTLKMQNDFLRGFLG